MGDKDGCNLLETKKDSYIKPNYLFGIIIICMYYFIYIVMMMFIWCRKC